MMWTPVQLPPHPFHVQSLTPIAQKVLDLLRDEGNVRAPHPVPPNRSQEANTTFLGRSEQEMFTADEVFDNSISKSEDYSSHFPHNTPVEQDTSALQRRITLESFPSAKVVSGHSFQYKNPDPEFKPQTSNMIEDVDPCHLVTNLPKIPQTTNVYNQLSPDMEFDDVNIYSNPFEDSQPNFHSATLEYNNTLSPILCKPPIRCLQRTKEFSSVKLVSKMEPSNQLFTFANMPKVSTNSKSGKFKLTSQQAQKNTKITTYFKSMEHTNNLERWKENNTNEKKNTNNRNVINEAEIINNIEENNTNKNGNNVNGNNRFLYNYIVGDKNNADNNSQNNDIVQSHSNGKTQGINDKGHTKAKEELSFTLSQSEPIESLFVNTQDSIKQREKIFKNENLDNNQSEPAEDLSIRPFQIQGTQQFHNFEVDDLFSCDDNTPTKHTNQTNLYDNTIMLRLYYPNDNSSIMFKKNDTENVTPVTKELHMLDSGSAHSQYYKRIQNNEKKDNSESKEKREKQTEQQDNDYIQLSDQTCGTKLAGLSNQLTHYNNVSNVSHPDKRTCKTTHGKINNDNMVFRKPQAPLATREFKAKRNYSEQNIVEQVKSFKKSKYEVNVYNNNNPVLKTDNIRKSKKHVQTTLFNLDSVKFKRKNKSRFVPPILSQQINENSAESDLALYNVISLDKVNAREILHRLAENIPHKVLCTITFKEGYTLLNKPMEPLKNSRCLPSGMMFLVRWSSNQNFHYWLPILNVESFDSSVHDIVHILLSSPEQVICFESQAVFMLLKDVFHFCNISEWFAQDPLIGCWLLDPDNPPKDFAEVALKLEIDKNLLTINSKDDIKLQACKLLPTLDTAMDTLKQRLLNFSLWTVFNDMETKLTPLLATMECSSILIDVKKLHDTAAVLDKIVRQLEKDAHRLAGHSFQLNSHKQLREVLFNELKLDEKFNITVKQTDHGSKSTSESVLSQLKNFHPLPNTVLEYRRLQKVKSTYMDGLIQHVNPDNTIGTTWEQVGAATGRITSKNPNLQTIPKTPVVLKSGENIHLRAVFKARDGFSFLAADFQQIEFRVFAHFTQDIKLLQAFQEGGDIFQRLATQWLGVEDKQQREKTKRIVYSIMYGAGPLLLAEYLHVDLAEAARVIKNFTDMFPCLRSLPQKVVAQCRTQGYLVTLSGRRRLFPNIRSPNCKLRAYSERQAINFLIQGSAADICKAAMLDCDTAVRREGLEAHLLLQIHDELVWEVADHHLSDTARAVREAMEHRWEERLCLRVPVPVSISTGKTLADMKTLAD